MAEDVGLMQDKASNACCAALKKKHSKLLEKYSKVEELKNKFRDCTTLLQTKYDAIEKENANLKKAYDELKVQANMWKDEKEKESGIRINLEDQVLALKDEVQLLKSNDNSGSQEANEQLQERLNVADKEIKTLKELLEKERRKAASEKKNAELEKKKVDEALKKLEMDKNMVSEAQKMANIERKRAEENRVLWEKLNKETEAVKSKLALEKSKSESAYKLVEVEKQNAIREKDRADSSLAKAEEQRKLAEMNWKKALSEKERADDLNQKFEEASKRVKKLEELHQLSCSQKFVETQADASDTGRSVGLPSGVHAELLKNDDALIQWMENMLGKKEQNIIRENKHADAVEKESKKQSKVANCYKRKAREQKRRADELSRELEGCRIRLQELQTELVKSYSYRICADNSSLRYNSIASETNIVKKLKNQLKLEKMLVKHAKRASEVEAFRNSMLHQELVQLKQEFLQFQLRFDMLNNTFLHSGEGIHQLEKIGNKISTRETLCSDDCHEQLISGINSGLDPPHRGSNQKMLQSSAINSSSASFSDRPLVGSQEMHNLSVASAKLSEDMSKLRPKSRLSAKTRIRHNDQTIVKADNTTKSSTPKKSDKRSIESNEKERILDAVKSIENLYCKGEKLHQQVSNKVALLHGILNGQRDEPEEENLKDNPCKDLGRPVKRRKISSEGTVVSNCVQANKDAKSTLDSDIGYSDPSMAALPHGHDAMKFNTHFKDGTNSILGSDEGKSQYFDMIVGNDYMKLLDLDNAADEDSYRRAIAMPLSPLSPEVELLVGEKFVADNPQMLLHKSSQEALPGFRDGMNVSSSFHDIDTEKKAVNAVLDGAVSSPLCTNEDSIEVLTSADSLPACDTDTCQIHDSGGKLRMPDLSASGSKEANTLHERRISTTPSGLLKYYVVFSDNKDNHSILRILQTTVSYMLHCSSLDSIEILIESILHALLKDRDLSMKEKVCVFFSLVLHGISEVGTKNWSKVLSYDLVQSLDSVTLRICSALTNPVLRGNIMESCDLFELLSLIEDFLLQRKVFVISDVSSEDAVSGSKVDLVLNGDVIMLSEVVASSPLLVAGGSMLASLCLGMDHIGCICEMSCNIITAQKCDPAVILAVLHTFAHVCGSKYFALQQYSLAMTVIKVLVMFLEKKTLSANSASVSPPLVGDLSISWLCCSDCPFSKGAVQMEDVALMLLENLHKQSQSVSWSKDAFEVVNSIVPRGRLHDCRNENVSGFMESVTSSPVYGENLCEFFDILSLMEILASFLDWNWMVEHIIARICESLKLHVEEGFSAAAMIILLGHLGRLGVEAGGYEDAGVQKLREWLSAFLCKASFVKFSLSVQFAIVTSLFGLTPIKFEQVIDHKVETTAALASQCGIPATFIREWFSVLSHEQQSHLRDSISSNPNQLLV